MGESRYEPLSQAEDIIPEDGTSYPLSNYRSRNAGYAASRTESSSSDDEDDEDINYPKLEVDEEIADTIPRHEKDFVNT